MVVEALLTEYEATISSAALDVQKSDASSTPDSEKPTETGIASTISSVEKGHRNLPLAKASQTANVTDEGKELFALSWSTVECWYEGELSGPGR